MPASPGYRYAADLFGDLDGQPAWRFLVVANLLALLPLAAAVLLLWLPYQAYVALGAPLALFPDPVWPDWARAAFALAALVGSMLTHEGLHGLALALQGHAPRFGWASGCLYVTLKPGDWLQRDEYLRMVLAPLAGLSLGGGALLLGLPPGLGQTAALVLLLNAAASVGDLIVADRARRWPPQARFADDGAIRVYLPEEAPSDARLTGDGGRPPSAPAAPGAAHRRAAAPEPRGGAGAGH